MNRLMAIIIGSLIYSPQGFADLESQRIYKSAYYLGRGDTGIATSDNHEAIFYNPAGLAYGKGIYKETVLLSPTIEVSTDTKDLVRKVAVEKKSDVETLRQHIGKPQHLGANNFTGVVFRRAALGAFFSTQTNFLVSKDKDQGALERVDANLVGNQGFVFSIAEQFFGGSVLLGATAKYIQRAQAKLEMNVIDAQTVADDLQEEDIIGNGAGGGADLGVQFRGSGRAPVSLGIHIENVGDTQITPQGSKKSEVLEDLKQTVNVGVAVEPGTKTSKFKLFADYRDATGEVEKNVYKRTHIGTEVDFRGFFGVTGGINQGYPTFGAFTDLYLMRLDVAMYTEEMGERIGSRPDKRFIFRLKVGF